MAALTRWLKIVRLRLLQVALQDAEDVGNREAVIRLAPQEAILRAELESI